MVKYKKWFIFAAVLIIGVIIGKIICCPLFCSCRNGDIVCGALNTAYEIEGRLIKMENGLKIEQLSGNSTATITTQIEKIPLKGSVSDDKTEGAAVILTQNAGGNGIYYYIASAIAEKRGVSGTNAIGIGDRITILGVEIENNIIYVTFLERGSDVGMENPPNVQVTRMFTVKDGILMPVG